jgi:adenylate cyclase
MKTVGYKRRLAAILSADVAGYSRLMGEDDEATVRTLTGHRQMMSAIINKNQGRVVDSPGDNLLAEFESALQSVECAVEIQRELAERNADLPKNQRMEYRIGVNLGDVIKEGTRIYGDGVNIAARLESMAEPGGICVSGLVYTQVKKKLKLKYKFLGKQAVKNISEPVPVYCIKSLPKAAIQQGIATEPVFIHFV